MQDDFGTDRQRASRIVLFGLGVVGAGVLIGLVWHRTSQRLDSSGGLPSAVRVANEPASPPVPEARADFGTMTGFQWSPREISLGPAGENIAVFPIDGRFLLLRTNTDASLSWTFTDFHGAPNWRNSGTKIRGRASACAAQNRLLMVARTAEQALSFAVLESFSAPIPSDWKPLEGNVAFDPQLAQESGRCYLLTVAPEGTPWLREFSASQGWNIALNLSGAITNTFGIASFPKRIAVFGRGTDGILYTNAVQAGIAAGWSGFGGKLEGPPSVFNRGEDLVIAARGPTGTLTLWSKAPPPASVAVPTMKGDPVALGLGKAAVAAFVDGSSLWATSANGITRAESEPLRLGSATRVFAALPLRDDSVGVLFERNRTLMVGTFVASKRLPTGTQAK